MVRSPTHPLSFLNASPPFDRLGEGERHDRDVLPVKKTIHSNFPGNSNCLHSRSPFFFLFEAGIFVRKKNYKGTQLLLFLILANHKRERLTCFGVKCFGGFHIDQFLLFRETLT
ncbi:hypothetical protein V2J09_008731 [Rumex salicifolius]